MRKNALTPISRRRLMIAAAAASVPRALRSSPALADAAVELVLHAAEIGPLAADGTRARMPVVNGMVAPPAIRATRGETTRLRLANRLDTGVMIEPRGARNSAAFEPFLGQAPVAPGEAREFALVLADAGTSFLRIRGGDGRVMARPAIPLVVAEAGPALADLDEVLLIEELAEHGGTTAAMSGQAAPSGLPRFTVNGRAAIDMPVRANARARLRLINASPRRVLGIAIGAEARVMAIDGHPAEPFPARGGRLALAPGNRMDVFIDIAEGSLAPGAAIAIALHDGSGGREIARLVHAEGPPLRPGPLPPPSPLPANALPTRIDLGSAARVDLDIGDAAGGWVPVSPALREKPPAFRVKRGRAVVCALKNPTPAPVTFHVHGHPFRLLDRLDDGWKPFWLDTLLVEPGRTERIAFAAGNPGGWTVTATPMDAALPELARWFAVE
jgi:FtsP/CotA-like multicopper oxidase with cupredoxin domain